MSRPILRPIGLGPQQVRAYIDHLDGENALFRLVHESFQLSYQQYRGIVQTDVDNLVGVYRGRGQDTLADMFDRVLLMGDGSVTSLVNPNDSPHTELNKLFVLYANRLDNTYDLIVAEASQKKCLSKDKLRSAVCGSPLWEQWAAWRCTLLLRATL